MARFGDKGPYGVGNVSIVTTIVNHAEPTRVKKIKAAMAKIDCSRSSVSKSNKRRVWSAASIEKCRKAKLEYWSKRRQV